MKKWTITLGVISMFDALYERQRIVRWIQDWFNENGKTASAVIGISGGKDSTIVAALLVEALGKDRVVGVLMPNGTQNDIVDSHCVVNRLNIRNCLININPMFNSIKYELTKNVTSLLPQDTIINIAPRIRMTLLYAVAQSLPKGGRVANTCNKSEDYIGYSTKYGDSAGDFAPIADYTKTEVVEIGKTFQDIPERLMVKAPSDGLCGYTDEERFGFTYDILDKYIREGVCDDKDIKQKIDTMHNANLHKLLPIPVCQYK